MKIQKTLGIIAFTLIGFLSFSVPASALITQEGLQGLGRVHGAGDITPQELNFSLSTELFPETYVEFTESVSIVSIPGFPSLPGIPVTVTTAEIKERVGTNVNIVGSYAMSDTFEMALRIPIRDAGEKLGIGNISIRGRYLFSPMNDMRFGALAGLDLPTGDKKKFLRSGQNIHLGGVFSWTSPSKPMNVFGELRMVLAGDIDYEIEGFKIKQEVKSFIMLNGGISYRPMDKLLLMAELGINGIADKAGYMGVGGAYTLSPQFEAFTNLYIGSGPLAPDYDILIGVQARFGKGIGNKSAVPKRARSKSRAPAKKKLAGGSGSASKSDLVEIVELLRGKKPDKALKKLKILKNKHPKDPRIPYYTGAAHLSNNDKKMAWNSFVKARNMAAKGSKVRINAQKKINQLSK